MATRTRLDTLLLFFEVVNAGSINKASEKLGTPKSTLSRKLRQLEEAMGSVLLIRGPQKLALTDTGRMLYGHAVRIVAEIEDAGLKASELQQEMRGTLRVSLPLDFWMSWIGEAISEFALMHPDLQLEIHNQDRWVDVSAEPYDVAIHLGPIHNQQVPVKRLGAISRGYYAAPSYLDGRALPRRQSDLVDCDCIVHAYQRLDRIWNVARAEDGDAIEIPSRISVNSIGFAQLLALRGIGIALLPDLLCHAEASQGSLIRLALEEEPPALQVSATFIGRRHLPRKTRAFLDFMAAQLERLAIAGP
ncbi:MAG: LysR family transcriptional regulator [Pigmentiphaga sp.]|nr:LysR family transcriptional regulator [Pigmentiphaga sp.]